MAIKKHRFAPKLHVKKGDQVKVISGSYKGTDGKVMEVFPKLGRATVEGVNIRKKHSKPTADEPGGINEINGTIHISNLMLIDPKSGEASKLGRKIVDGKSVRYSKKSGEIIK